MRPGGRVGVLGYYADERVEIRPSDIMMRDLEVIGAVCPTGTWEAAVELLAAGRVDTEALITHVLPLERLRRGLPLARGGPGVIKVVLEI